MRALLIDPQTETVTETSITSWRDIAPAIDAQLFDVVNIDDFRHSIYVDDEGLYTKIYRFAYVGYHQWLMGKGLIMGFDEDTGDSTDCTLTIAEVLNNTLFETQIR